MRLFFAPTGIPASGYVFVRRVTPVMSRGAVGARCSWHDSVEAFLADLLPSLLPLPPPLPPPPPLLPLPPPPLLQVEIDKPVGLTFVESDAAGGGLVVKVREKAVAVCVCVRAGWRAHVRVRACKRAGERAGVFL